MFAPISPTSIPRFICCRLRLRKTTAEKKVRDAGIGVIVAAGGPMAIMLILHGPNCELMCLF